MSDHPKDESWVSDKVAEILEKHGDIESRVGVGDPSSPYAGQLLSEEDEKRLGPDGELIISPTSLPWSEAQTGTYFAVYLTPKPLPMAKLEGIVYGHADTRFGSAYLNITASAGKPVVGMDYVGACLELPADLSRDPIKQQYVGEWALHTLAESAALVLRKKPSEAMWKHVGEWIEQHGDEIIRKVGL